MAWIDYKNLRYYPAKLENSQSENVHDIRISRKVYLGNHERLASWIDSRRKNLSWTGNPERYLPGRCFFTITICNRDNTTLSHKKCTEGYKFTKSQEKINHIMYMDDIKLFAKNERELECILQTIRTYSHDIRMEYGRENNANNGNSRRKRKLQLLGNTGSEHHQTSRDERKKLKKSISDERENSKPNRNLMKRVHTWSVSLVRYTRSFLKWSREELKQMDQRTRKLMMMHKALYLGDDIGRLYISSNEWGRGLAGIKDSVDSSFWGFENYKKSKERPFKATRQSTDNICINRTKITRKQKWEEKQLYGYFKRQTYAISLENLDMALKGKLQERNWISSDSNTKQRHKEQLY